MRDYIKLENDLQSQKKQSPIAETTEHPIKDLLHNRAFMVILISQSIFWMASNIGLGVIEIFFKDLNIFASLRRKTQCPVYAQSAI